MYLLNSIKKLLPILSGTMIMVIAIIICISDVVNWNIVHREPFHEIIGVIFIAIVSFKATIFLIEKTDYKEYKFPTLFRLQQILAVLVAVAFFFYSMYKKDYLLQTFGTSYLGLLIEIIIMVILVVLSYYLSFIPTLKKRSGITLKRKSKFKNGLPKVKHSSSKKAEIFEEFKFLFQPGDDESLKDIIDGNVPRQKLTYFGNSGKGTLTYTRLYDFFNKAFNLNFKYCDELPTFISKHFQIIENNQICEIPEYKMKTNYERYIKRNEVNHKKN